MTVVRRRLNLDTFSTDLLDVFMLCFLSILFTKNKHNTGVRRFRCIYIRLVPVLQPLQSEKFIPAWKLETQCLCLLKTLYAKRFIKIYRYYGDLGLCFMSWTVDELLLRKQIKCNMILSRVGVTYKKGFVLNDWIYWRLIHRTRD
jgi:transposase InsO family protein